MDQILVSITVTTRNEEKNIEKCLQSIRLQTYQNIEIIVVDNFSTDRTKEIALGYTEKVYDKGPERSAQRNFGMIDISSGRYVMFVDADMILSPSLIKSCVDLIERGDFLALHVPEVVLGKKYFSTVRRFERSFYNGTVIDGARFFLKEAFVKSGGFDETMSGPEDWDIDKKIKKLGKIGLLREKEAVKGWEMKSFIIDRGVNPLCYGSVIYHNEAEFDLKMYFAKKGYYAKSFDIYINKWGEDDPDIKKQFGLYYRFLGVFIENGKWKKLVLHLIMTFGMYLLRIMVGFGFLVRNKGYNI